jgi:hypothetical protein
VIKDERLGIADEIRANLSASVLPVFDRLRTLMSVIDDQSTETASPREKALYYTLGRGKMTDGYAYIMAHSEHVNLGFFHGDVLSDPQKILEGNGKKLRHVKLRTVDEVDAPRVRDMIETAFNHIMQIKGRP